MTVFIARARNEYTLLRRLVTEQLWLNKVSVRFTQNWHRQDGKATTTSYYYDDSLFKNLESVCRRNKKGHMKTKMDII